MIPEQQQGPKGILRNRAKQFAHGAGVQSLMDMAQLEAFIRQTVDRDLGAE